MSSPVTRSGRVLTFYSFKGGTGRSMALANVAWILATNGKRVLTIDWDLEAPGLHRYFGPFLEDPDLQETEGLIDLLLHYMVAATKPELQRQPADTADPDRSWYQPFADISMHAEPIQWSFPDHGGIDLLAAGRHDSAYASRVNHFQWVAFYEKFGGAAFLEEVIRQARTAYDYVLIDSRTGVSDTSGICTVHLPDALVVFYTLNNQSILGASEVAEAVRQSHRSAGHEGFPIYPVATRVELAEKDRLNIRRKLARRRFEPFLDWMPSDQRGDYLGQMEILYDPYYAYEETLATLADQPGSRNSVLSSLEYLTASLTEGNVSRTVHGTDELRSSAKQRYESFNADESSPQTDEPIDIFISYHEGSVDAAKEFEAGIRPYARVFSDDSLRPGDDWQSALIAAAERARVVVVFPHKSSLSPSQLHEINAAQSSLDSVRGKRIIPVISEAEWVVPGELDSYHALKAGNPREMQEAIRQVLALFSIEPAPERQADGSSPATGSADSSPTSPAASAASPASPPPAAAEPAPPPSASAPHPAERKAARRPAWAWAAAALLLLLPALWFVLRLSGDSKQGQQASLLATQANDLLTTDPTLSLLLATEAIQLEQSPVTESAVRAALQAQFELRRFELPAAPTPVVEWSPSGDLFSMVTIDGNALVGNPSQPKPEWSSTDVLDTVWLPARNRQSESLITIDTDGSCESWPGQRHSPAQGPLGEAVLAPNGSLAVATTDKGVAILRPVWNASPKQVEAAPEPIYFGTFESNIPTRPWDRSSTRLSTLNGSQIEIWMPNADGFQGPVTVALGADVSNTAWHPAGDLIAAGLEQGGIAIADVGPRPRVRFGTTLTAATISDIAWSAQGNRLAAISTDGEARILEVDLDALTSPQRRSASIDDMPLIIPAAREAGGRPAPPARPIGIIRHEGAARLAWAPDGRRLATWSADGTIKIWSERGEVLQTMIAKDGRFVGAAWNSAGDRLLSVGNDKLARVWRVGPDPTIGRLTAQELPAAAAERTPRTLTEEELALYLGGRRGGGGGW